MTDQQHAFTPGRWSRGRVAGPRQFISNHYPPTHRNALVRAAAAGDAALIDTITDELASKGLCRPRQASGLFESIQVTAQTSGGA